MRTALEHAELLDRLRSLEVLLLQRTVRSSREQLEELLAEDFTEIGRSGRMYDRAGVIELLLRAPQTDVELEESSAVLRLLADGVALLTYRTRALRPAAEPSRETLRSSIWRCEGERWRMVFHQGTAAPAGG